MSGKGSIQGLSEETRDNECPASSQEASLRRPNLRNVGLVGGQGVCHFVCLRVREGGPCWARRPVRQPTTATSCPRYLTTTSGQTPREPHFSPTALSQTFSAWHLRPVSIHRETGRLVEDFFVASSCASLLLSPRGATVAINKNLVCVFLHPPGFLRNTIQRPPGNLCLHPSFALSLSNLLFFIFSFILSF